MYTHHVCSAFLDFYRRIEHHIYPAPVAANGRQGYGFLSYALVVCAVALPYVCGKRARNSLQIDAHTDEALSRHHRVGNVFCVPKVSHAIIICTVIAVTRRTRLDVGRTYCCPLCTPLACVWVLPCDVKHVAVGRCLCFNSVCRNVAMTHNDGAFVHTGCGIKGFRIYVVIGFADG